MAKLIYEKPELISLIEQDSAMGRCQNGSVNLTYGCKSGSVAKAGTCAVGTSAGTSCASGVSAISSCSTGSNKMIPTCKGGSSATTTCKSGGKKV